MQASEILKLIRQLTGLTQDSLARKLGVTFPTVNSWLLGKSVPRKSAQQRISHLYQELVGVKFVAPNLLAAQHDVILNYKKKFPSVLKFIERNPDVRDQLILSLTYNTNSLEGSSLTEHETAAIIFRNRALPNKTLAEQLEAKNHQTALHYLLRYFRQKRPINEALVKYLHAILMNGIRDDAGDYRQHAVRIVASPVITANYVKVPQLMKQLMRDLIKGSKDFIRLVVQMHSRFEQIHPFSDGNGRIGRLLIQAMLLKKDLAPAIILQKNRERYLQGLQKAQLHKEWETLSQLLHSAVIEGYRILDRAF